MDNYLNKKTIEKIEELTELCKNMRRIGQHFLILEGGIAVGKTLFAKEIAKRLANNDDNKIHFFQLHEGYSYNNFIYGQQIRTNKGQIKYEKGNQPLLEIINECVQKTEGDAEELHIVILDDMNRCNVSAVLGDLLSALESNEVGNVIKTDEGDVALPNNLFFIGTMNPLVGKESIDYAWFRRFTVVELKADSVYFEADENEIKEYEEYKWFAKELFEHVKMLFENYFVDKDNYRELGKYIIGPGIFIQYDHKKYFYDNVSNLQQRIKYTIVPLLNEYVYQGILLDYITKDLIALEHIFGSELKFDNLKNNSRSGNFHELYSKIRNYNNYTNIIFLFLLHSHIDQLRIKILDKSVSIIENEGYVKDYPISEYVGNAKKQSNRPVYGSSTIEVNGDKYNLIAGTAHGSMLVYVHEERNYVKATDAMIIPKNLILNMDYLLNRIENFISRLESKDE